MENETRYYKLKQSNILGITCCSKTNEEWDRLSERAKEIRRYGKLD